MSKGKTNTFRGLAYSKNFSYNKSRVASVVDSTSLNSATLSNVSFVYDELGRIASETDSVTGTTKSNEYNKLPTEAGEYEISFIGVDGDLTRIVSCTKCKYIIK